ncbi:polycomb protein suz12-B-like [Mytilus edulis]|uniref:polycomb protein suz12-B-like n=1 Tax=Mytilus edulis TaxID=6550 RepID=UPI0039F1481E
MRQNRPKKRQKDKQKHEDNQTDASQADREMFLQAFEKPTQIYRYLRNRHLVAPLFLQRTLCYMKHRRSRDNSKRKNFKSSSLLSTVEQKLTKTLCQEKAKSHFINLTFNGFFSQSALNCEEAEVEAKLLKICHKKRKDVSSPVLQTSLGKLTIPVNPDADESLSKTSTISVPQHHFSHSSGHSFTLLLSVKLLPNITNGLHNGDISDEDEPPSKKQKNGFDTELDIYESDLVIYDRQRRCQLSDGMYEVVLHQIHTDHGKEATWESVMDGKSLQPFEVFSRCPTLEFHIHWTDKTGSSDPVSGTPIPFTEQYSSPTPDSGNNEIKETNQTTPKKTQRIYYQFLYNNNTRQQTDPRDDMKCPWCSLNCVHLYSLLKHLRLSHARFNFIYVVHPKGARIDVSINDQYDGSYVGNPQDLHSHVGYAFCRRGPVRRTPITHVIVYRPKRPPHSLVEFMEPECENQVNRQITQGHNRLYFHLGTCQPVKPSEIDMEDEITPQWLRQKTVNMIDEFTDVNEGEKELMKLWNLHVMKNNYISDCQIVTAALEFVTLHGQEILQKNLYQNFILHMVNLFDFSLIKPEEVQKILTKLEEIKTSMS